MTAEQCAEEMGVLNSREPAPASWWKSPAPSERQLSGLVLIIELSRLISGSLC